MVLNLTYPQPQEGQEFLIETDPKILQKLIENDGSFDLDCDIKRITKLLHDLNRCPKSLSQSEELLKIFHSKYSSFCEALRDYSTDSVNDASSIDELMHNLTREMTFSFKAYLELLSQNGNWVFRLSKKAAFGVTYALHYLSLLKAELYSFGRALPSYLLPEIYHLYQYAEAHNLVKIKVKDPTKNKISVALNPQNSFVRASLMASMEPYQLSRIEIWNLFHKLNSFVEYVKIGSDPEILKDAHCFEFNYEHSERPKLLRVKQLHDENSRYMEVESFSSKVKDELMNFNSNRPQRYPFLTSNKPELQEKLLQLMYKYSVQYISRSSDRYPVDVETKALYGLQDIIELLKSDLDLAQFPRQEKFEDFSTSIVSDQNVLWQMVNESSGGACIEQEQNPELNIENLTPLIISKKLPGKEGAWKLAMTRWSKTANAKGQVGLQYIKGKLRVVQSANNNSQEFVFVGPDTKGNLFLITQKGALSDVKNFVLIMNNKKLLVCKKSSFELSDSDMIKIDLLKKST